MPPLPPPTAAPRPRDRRSFVAAVTAMLGTLAARPALAHAGPAAGRGDAPAPPWDLAWLEQLTGKHRQVFDLGGRNPAVKNNPLVVPRNWLNAHRDVYGLQPPAVNTVVGITSDAFPLNAGDALWQKYALGERWKIPDPATKAWATRNVYVEPRPEWPGASIRELLARGTMFWQCNNALGGVAHELADATGQPFEAVRAELTAGLLPHVHLVPAHTMLLGLSQEHGCTYEKL